MIFLPLYQRNFYPKSQEPGLRNTWCALPVFERSSMLIGTTNCLLALFLCKYQTGRHIQMAEEWLVKIFHWNMIPYHIHIVWNTVHTKYSVAMGCVACCVSLCFIVFRSVPLDFIFYSSFSCSSLHYSLLITHYPPKVDQDFQPSWIFSSLFLSVY